LAGLIVTLSQVVVATARPLEPSWGMAIIEGPTVKILVTDFRGNRTGWDPGTQSVVMEIPHSNYLDEGGTGTVDLPMFVVYLDNPPSGRYELRAFGKNSGGFFIEVNTESRKDNWRMTRFEGSIIPGREYVYQINFDPVDPSKTSVVPATWEVAWKGNLEKDVPLTVDRGKKVKLCLEVKEIDGESAENLRIRIMLVKESATKSSPVPMQDEVATHFKWNPLKDLYHSELKTDNLEPGRWQIQAILDDGSVHSRWIEIR
jgi:hypothetical protein